MAGDVVKNLFVQIGTKFDSKGFDQAGKAMEKNGQQQKDLAKIAKVQLAQAFDDLKGKIDSFNQALYSGTIGAFREYEKSLLGAKKTLDLTGESYDRVFVAGLRLSNMTGIKSTEIAQIMELGGQLGVATDEIVGFTLVVSKMSVAFGISGEEAATNAAKIANAFRMEATAEGLTRIGDVVNKLSDSAALSAGELMNFLKQFGSIAGAMNISLEKAGSLGSMLIAAGLRAEDASTSVKAAIVQMTQTTGEISKADIAAKVLHTTTENFLKMVSKDAIGTFTLLSKKIVENRDSTMALKLATEIFGIDGMKSALLVGKSWQEMARLIEIANKSATGSMDKEFLSVLGSFDRNMTRIGVIISNIGILIGESMSDKLKSNVFMIANFLGGLFITISENEEVQYILSGIALSMIYLAGAMGLLAGYKSLAITFGLLSTVIGGMFTGSLIVAAGVATALGLAVYFALGGSVEEVSDIIIRAVDIVAWAGDVSIRVLQEIWKALKLVPRIAMGVFNSVKYAFVTVITFITEKISKTLDYFESTAKSISDSVGIPLIKIKSPSGLRSMVDEMKALQNDLLKNAEMDTDVGFRSIKDIGLEKGPLESMVEGMRKMTARGMKGGLDEFIKSVKDKVEKAKSADLFGLGGVDVKKQMEEQLKKQKEREKQLKKETKAKERALKKRSKKTGTRGGGVSTRIGNDFLDAKIDVSGIDDSIIRRMQAESDHWLKMKYIDSPFATFAEKQAALAELQRREQQRENTRKLKESEKMKQDKELAKQKGEDWVKVKVERTGNRFLDSLVDDLIIYTNSRRVCGD